MFVNNAEMELPLAKVAPISQNIKNFQKITMRFANLFGQSYKCRWQIDRISGRYFREDKRKEWIVFFEADKKVHTRKIAIYRRF
jgi:hypothetical protein